MFKRIITSILGAGLIAVPAFAAAPSSLSLTADLDGDSLSDTVVLTKVTGGKKLRFTVNFGNGSTKAFSVKNNFFDRMLVTDWDGDSAGDIVAIVNGTKSHRVRGWTHQGILIANQNVGKKLMKGVASASLASLDIPDDFYGGLGKVGCSDVRNNTSREIWKPSASGHIPKSDPRSSSTSWIYLQGGSPSPYSCISVYDRNGNKVHQLGVYARGGEYPARFYGGSGCGDGKSASSIANAARAKTGSAEVYLKVSNKTCVRIENAGQRDDG